MSHGPFDLRHHHDVQARADRCDQCHQVVEHPRRLQRVDPRPQRRRTEVDLLPDPHQAGARGLLAIGRDRVLQIAQQNVRRSGHIRQPGEHLLAGRIEEMDHPRRGHGDLANGVGRADGQRREVGARVAHPAPSWRSMSPVDTDGATREASGAHPYGRYLEEFEVGAIYKHWPAKTVTEADDHLFCLLTMNHHPLHINDVYAAQLPAGQERRRGAVRLLPRARHERVRHHAARRSPTSPPRRSPTRRPSSTATRCSPRPRCSRSRNHAASPTAAPCRVHTRVLNQEGTLVAEFKRLVLVPKREV